jgi:hypothetical protein
VVSNLMVSFTSGMLDGGLLRRREQEPWLGEYTRGMAFELYSHPLPPSFQGLSFSEVRTLARMRAWIALRCLRRSLSVGYLGVITELYTCGRLCWISIIRLWS